MDHLLDETNKIDDLDQITGPRLEKVSYETDIGAMWYPFPQTLLTRMQNTHVSVLSLKSLTLH